VVEIDVPIETPIPQPAVTISAYLYAWEPGRDYVYVVGTIKGTDDKDRFPVRTRLRVYDNYDNFMLGTGEILAATGRIGFFSSERIRLGDLRFGLDSLVTDTLRARTLYHHFVRTVDFLYNGGPLWYDWSVEVGTGVVRREVGWEIQTGGRIER